MTVVIDYRTGGREELKDVEFFYEDRQHLFLMFKETCKTKIAKYSRRNVKLNCVRDIKE